MWTQLAKGELILFERCLVAQTFFSRFLGLMGRKHLPENEAILFPKCSSIHTFFMRMSIDVVYVSSQGKVVKILSGLKPWRMLIPVSEAVHVIEMSSQMARHKNIEIGDKLNCPGVF